MVDIQDRYAFSCRGWPDTHLTLLAWVLTHDGFYPLHDPVSLALRVSVCVWFSRPPLPPPPLDARPGAQPQQEQSLFAELADTSNECAECLDWQQKNELAKGQHKNELAKVGVTRPAVDLNDPLNPPMTRYMTHPMIYSMTHSIPQ